jgi:hypothetical protein
MKYHSCPQSKNVVKKRTMKAKLILILAAIASIFGTVSCNPQENLPEMSTAKIRTIAIHDEKVNITTVWIDGREYLAVSQGGGRWNLCPVLSK